MDETSNPKWYFRRGGIITHAAAEDGRDPSLLLRANGFAKRTRGEPLTEAEAAALETHKGKPLIGTPVGDAWSETAQGFLFHDYADLVRELDALALKIGERLGFDTGERMAWEMIAQYAANAERAVREDLGLVDEPEVYEDPAYNEIHMDPEAIAQPGGQRVTLKDGSELTITPGPDYTPEELAAKKAEEQAASEAWQKTPEGQRQVAAFMAEMQGRMAALTPNGGPEGWSTVPPVNPHHPVNQVLKGDA